MSSSPVRPPLGAATPQQYQKAPKDSTGKPSTAILAGPRPNSPEKKSMWLNELEKFTNQQVRVTYSTWNTTHELTGKLVGINTGALFIIIQTDEKKIFVRHPLLIERLRS